MTEPTNSSDKPLDQKEAMRQALEAKRKHQHQHNEGAAGAKSMGVAHSKAAGKRQFRRKAGG